MYVIVIFCRPSFCSVGSEAIILPNKFSIYSPSYYFDLPNWVISLPIFYGSSQIPEEPIKTLPISYFLNGVNEGSLIINP